SVGQLNRGSAMKMSLTMKHAACWRICIICWEGKALAKHLTDRDILRVVELLDTWNSKLTWERLCDACEAEIGTRPTRQTLSKFSRVTEAYKACKDRIKNQDEALSVPPTLKMAAERIERLKRENERLKRENGNLLEQFVVWQYN